MRITLGCISLVILFGSLVHASAQAPPAGANWEHLKALPPHTRVHIASDKKGRNCFVESVDDDQLVCSNARIGHGSSEYVFPRAEIKSVKLTRYTRSTLVGLGIGAGAGLGVGAILGHSRDPAQPNQLLDFSSIGRETYTLGGGAIGLIAGAAIGGPTDFLRGPTVYQRP